jgi:hypothetical protein
MGKPEQISIYTSAYLHIHTFNYYQINRLSVFRTSGVKTIFALL